MQTIDLNNLDKSNWKTYRFDEIAKNISERVDPNNTDLEVYIGLEHIDSDSIHIKRAGTPDDVNGQKLRCYPGDVIFGRRRAYQRKAAISTVDGFCSAHSLVLRAKPDVIEPNLFPFFLHSDLFMHRAVDISVGSLSPTINWGTLKHQEFLLPPKDQQAQLAELLWAMDEVVQANKNFLEKIKLFQEVTCLQLLGLRKDRNEGRKWKIKSLLDVAPLQRGFDLPSDKLMNGKYPVCYSNGIRNQNENYMVNGPGVCTGRSGTIGNVFYIEQDYWPHNTTLWVTDFKGNHPKYIYHLYSKLHFEKKMAGTGVPTLNRNDIHQIKVRIPDIDDQISISNQLDSIENKIDHACNLFDKSKSLQKSLINQIF